MMSIAALESVVDVPASKITITVRPDHIDRGAPRASHLCPVALAIAERFGVSSRAVAIFKRHAVILWSVDDHDSVDLPEKVVAFIDDFDAHRHVQPLSFELQLRWARAREAPP